jgi:hypothetical protein
MKPTMHISFAIVAITLLALDKLSIAQTQPSHKSTTISSNGDKSTTPMVFKNEQGNPLTAKEAFALTKTGNYKMVKQTDKDKKPFLLIVYSPGYAPRPQSAPFKVTPANVAKP